MASTTAKDVFDIAMSLMDESGADVREYEPRALHILDVLAGELYHFSDTYELKEPGKRPVIARISDYNAVIDLDDFLCRSILPFGLAALLFQEENPDAANLFQQKYEEGIRNYGDRTPGEFSAIQSFYGGIEHGEFGRW